MMNEINTLPNQWMPEIIGKWLLNGMQRWDEFEEPWVHAFKPLSLYHDQDLELQLIAHFAKTGSHHAILNFTSAVVFALENWSRKLHSYVALEGLLHIVSEISALETLPLIRKLILEDLQSPSKECKSALMVAINTLTCLSPKRAAVTLLKNIQSRGKPVWHSEFAPLAFIAYIVADPENWFMYLADLRSDFMQLEKTPDTDLDPEIFFVEVVDILGVQTIADNLHQLNINSNPAKRGALIDADKWFIDKMIGLPNSRLMVLRGSAENQWNLMYSKHYPNGNRYAVSLPNNKPISSRLSSIFQGYTSFADRQCKQLAAKLIEAINNKAISEVSKIRESIIELYIAYNNIALRHMYTFSSNLSTEVIRQAEFTSILEEISGIQSDNSISTYSSEREVPAVHHAMNDPIWDRSMAENQEIAE